MTLTQKISGWFTGKGKLRTEIERENRAIRNTSLALVAVCGLVRGYDFWMQKQAERRAELGYDAQQKGIYSAPEDAANSIPNSPVQNPLEKANLENSTTNPNMPFADNFDFIPEMNDSADSRRRTSKNNSVPYLPQKPGNLISNEFFRDHQFLTEEQIKDLLMQNKSCLSNTGVERAIIENAKQYQVNPAILLARLQVEKGLVTKKRAGDRTLRYAMGYGVFDNGRKLPSGGIASQIKNAARTLDMHYGEFKPGTKVKVDYGARTLSPKHPAEYALLRYTPHTKGYELNKSVLARIVAQTIVKEQIN